VTSTATPTSISTRTRTATPTRTATEAAAPTPTRIASAARTAVAVLAAPVTVPSPPPADELEPRIVAELRAALRGCTGEQLGSVLGAPAGRVDAALAALAARGAVERRGTRWFVS
jgi:hypothetical protein